MDAKLHFISGLPRSGSTLLSSLLRQNPRITAGMTSPVGHLVSAMLRETSMRNEDAVFIDDEMRERLLRGVFDAYYPDAGADGIVFDTNRMWTSKLHLVAEMFPQAKVICCVRSPAWIIDSIETLTRKNPYELSGIFGFESGGTIYSRADALSGPAGMVGFAINALREAVYGPLRDRLMLVQYDTLAARPLEVLEAIHDFIGAEMGAHDPKRIKPSYDMYEFDRRLGTPGLHAVRGVVAPRLRETLLPPDLFTLHDNRAFWRDRASLPQGLRVL
jgi:sulfotransferase